ncbi:MAG: CpaD family pilus assembly lipoprotein [Rhizobiaceae bacterium]|nr:CpaD family pilus assembly lipoprotein [Rhizobiaceae bacterium]MCV0404760.1 CpaD family pilus assembly lipoprotein [Rhizobiaceae bacterium]
MNEVRLSRTLRSAGIALFAALLATGCAKRDSIIVGSVPDDYRTNHPITISEQEEAIDIPVAASSHRLSANQKAALDGFFANYDVQAGAPISILVPSGGANELAASEVARDMARHLSQGGIPGHRITTYAYSTGSSTASAPIRVTYTALRAQAGPCGRWNADLLNNAENKHYTNFGCASQNNLAAQIANPADLLGPRKPSPIDAENRGVAISDYKEKIDLFEPNINY